jgi:hypothetical protein
MKQDKINNQSLLNFVNIVANPLPTSQRFALFMIWLSSLLIEPVLSVATDCTWWGLIVCLNNKLGLYLTTNPPIYTQIFRMKSSIFTANTSNADSLMAIITHSNTSIIRKWMSFLSEKSESNPIMHQSTTITYFPPRYHILIWQVLIDVMW